MSADKEDREAQAVLDMLVGVADCVGGCGRRIQLHTAPDSGQCFWCFIAAIDGYHQVNVENFDGWPTVGFAPSDNTQGNQ